MIRIVEEDGCCPVCEREIWQNSNGLWLCACGEVWKEGKYMRNQSQQTQLAALRILETIVHGMKDV